jgi:hypothetical protein
MRISWISFVIAALGTSVLAGEEKFVIHPQGIVSVRAIDAEVEVLASTRFDATSPFGPNHTPSIVFSFTLGPSMDVLKDMYISSASFTPGRFTVRFRLRDAKAAADLAAFLEMKRPKRSNQAMQLTAGRSAFPPNMTSTSTLQSKLALASGS